MGSSRGQMAGKSKGMESGASVSGPERMAGDILAGVEKDGIIGQETEDENIMEMPDFDSPTQDSLAGGFLSQEKPTVGGSYLGGARQNF